MLHMTVRSRGKLGRSLWSDPSAVATTGHNLLSSDEMNQMKW